MGLIKNISINKILILLTSLLLLAILVRSSILFLHQSSTSYGLTEWLINYEGGFTRRGLLGQLLFYFHKNFFIKINYIILFLCIFFYLWIVYYFTIKLKNTYPILFLLSPILLGMPILTDFFIRKDILGLIFLIILITICKSNLKSLKFFITINIFYIIFILINETILFYSFLIIFLFILERNRINKNYLFNSIYSFAILSPSLILFLILIFLNSNFDGSNEIHNSWQNLWIFISPQDCCNYEIGGEILALENEKINFFNFSNFVYKYPLKFLVWIFSIFICFLFVVNFLKEKEKENKIYVFQILILQLINLFPLFFFAGDWGRWIFFWISSTLIAYINKIKIDYIFLGNLDSFSKKMISKKIFKIRLNPIYLIFIGFPMVHYQWSFFNYYMVSIFGKISAIIYKIITKGIGVYF